MDPLMDPSSCRVWRLDGAQLAHFTLKLHNKAQSSTQCTRQIEQLQQKVLAHVPSSLAIRI